MLKVTREKLEFASLYVDVNNPKFELNYLYVDSKCMVSTNTRALAVVKHSCAVDKAFYVHKSIVDLALKQAKAKLFLLKPNSIMCQDANGDEILTILLSDSLADDNYRFPEYSRIIPSVMAHKIPFSNASHIDGIFATHGVLVDNKHVPKKFGVDFHGYIGINSSNLPVTISSDDGAVLLVLMPIIDNFFDFNDKESDNGK